MDVRKYEAFSMQEAIKLVRKELGKDAVILSTREKEGPRNSGLSVRKIVEIVAARGAESASVSNSNAASNSAVQTPTMRQSKPAPQNQNLRRPVFPNVTPPSQTTVVKSSPALSNLSADSKKILSNVMNMDYRNEKPVFDEPMRQAALSTTKEIDDLRGEISRIRKEIGNIPNVNMGDEVQEIKVLLHDIMRNQQRKEQSKYHEYLIDVAVKLRAAGVTEGLITELCMTLSGLPLPKNQDGAVITGEKLREFYFNSSVKIVMKQLQVTTIEKPESIGPQIICLIGPTGVGKTTTLAKLAAKFKVQQGKKVAIVSMDTFRIAASDQLRVYGKILDCPFSEIHDGQELLKFVQSKQDCDYIFVDTAGRSFRYLSQMEELRKLQALAMPIHFHLVLSSTMKQRDLDENIKAFMFLSPESFIFTKLDESWSFGEIFNSSIRSKIPLSCFTTGQRVPEDLEQASKERVVERLFRI